MLIGFLVFFISILDAGQRHSFSMKSVPRFRQDKLVEEFVVSVKATDGNLVAKADGWIGCVNKERVCSLKNIAVVEQYRLQGIGKETMNFIKNYAQRENCTSIKLSSTYISHHFYQKLGFHKDGENSGLIPHTLLLSQFDGGKNN